MKRYSQLFGKYYDGSKEKFYTLPILTKTINIGKPNPSMVTYQIYLLVKKEWCLSIEKAKICKNYMRSGKTTSLIKKKIMMGV